MPVYVQVVVGCQPFARGAKRDAYMVWEVDRNGSVGDRVLVGKFPRVMSPLGTPTGLAGFAGSSVAVGRGGATPSRRSSMSQCVMQSLCDARAHLSARTSHTHTYAQLLLLSLSHRIGETTRSTSLTTPTGKKHMLACMPLVSPSLSPFVDAYLADELGGSEGEEEGGEEGGKPSEEALWAAALVQNLAGDYAQGFNRWLMICVCLSLHF